ncbi:hypothetical protein WR25_02197 [Diploscapter pachys]|uniref:Uncharacterized protein n=1 Tax=Diploscapter pachys TaxID=2018661 RepID=A0A2A2J902_9BILA|nr:hypothetical protein WR25_02197 [Diploscapter pachys]
MSRSHSNGLDPPSNQISRNMSDGMADSRNETLAEVQALQKLGINVNPADLVDDDSYCEVVGVARPEEQPYNVPQSQLNMDALVEDVKLLVHCNLLCDVSKFMGGSPIEQLNTEMAKITQWGLTYEYMAQILQHKYENFDLKKKERLLKHPMFGQIVEVVLLKNEYMYKAKSTPRLKELYRQLHSAYNCQMIKRRFNEKQKRTMLKLMSPNERRASMHFCNYLNDLIIRMILRFKKIENIHNVPPDEFEETGVSYQKIDNLHRAIVAEKENGQNSDLYTKYAAILEFDKLTFKEASEMFGILHSHFYDR